MNTANVFSRSLSLEEVRELAPAVFADSADEHLSRRYTFIPTNRVLVGLMNVGFVPVEVRQARTYRASPMHAAHTIRLRRRYEHISLRDSCPEIRLWNSHAGGQAYQARMSLWRAVCTNGLIVSRAAFPAVYVPHRGNVVDEVVTGALRLAERFDILAAQVERMESRHLPKDEQLCFAERALAIRFADPAHCGILPSQLLTIRRPEDLGDDLYTLLNRTQENLMRGGLTRRSESGRLTRTRRVTSLRHDVRINSQLWDLAREVLAA
jgi:hypothetical protein